MKEQEAAHSFEGHTPGPYIVKNEGHYFRSPGVFGNDGKQLIYSVYGATTEERHANANLGAAAPDLLAELNRLRSELQRERDKARNQAIDECQKQLLTFLGQVEDMTPEQLYKKLESLKTIST